MDITKKFHYDADTKEVELKPFYDDDASVVKPFIELSYGEWESTLACCPIGKTWKVGDDMSLFLCDKETDESIKASYFCEIHSIEEWFRKYDIQISEFERAQRNGNDFSLHIDGTDYASVADMDREADLKATRIKELQSEL